MKDKGKELSTFLSHKDLLEYEHETEKHEEEVEKHREKLKKYREEFEAVKKKAQNFKDEFISKVKLTKKLIEEANRCRANVKELEKTLEDNKAKYKGKIQLLKD
ncbi:hypothetical protein ACOSQ3_016667 [Xanthoceras sorbifolium]